MTNDKLEEYIEFAFALLFMFIVYFVVFRAWAIWGVFK